MGDARAWPFKAVNSSAWPPFSPLGGYKIGCEVLECRLHRICFLVWKFLFIQRCNITCKNVNYIYDWQHLENLIVPLNIRQSLLFTIGDTKFSQEILQEIIRKPSQVPLKSSNKRILRQWYSDACCCVTRDALS